MPRLIDTIYSDRKKHLDESVREKGMELMKNGESATVKSSTRMTIMMSCTFKKTLKMSNPQSVPIRKRCLKLIVTYLYTY